MGEEGNLRHRATVNPVLLDVIGPVRGRRVLALGCGNGYLTRQWAREGARSSVGVDSARTSLKLARAREKARPTGARFVCRDSSKLVGIPDGSVDRVASNMALMDIADAEGTFKEVARVLAPNGRVLELCQGGPFVHD